MYAKLENGTFIPAPNKLHKIVEDREVFIVNPSDEVLLEEGYLPVEESEYPECEEGFHAECHYEERDGSIVQVWEIVKDEVAEVEE